MPLHSAKPRWTEDALGDDTRELAGVRCRVVSLVSLERTKARAREDAEDAAKDRADSDLLAELGG